MNCGTFVVIHIPPHARRLDWWLAWHTQSGLLNSLAKCRSCSIILCLWSRALNTQQESLSSRFEWISILLLFCRRRRKGPSEEGPDNASIQDGAVADVEWEGTLVVSQPVSCCCCYWPCVLLDGFVWGRGEACVLVGLLCWNSSSIFSRNAEMSPMKRKQVRNITTLMSFVCWGQGGLIKDPVLLRKVFKLSSFSVIAEREWSFLFVAFNTKEKTCKGILKKLITKWNLRPFLFVSTPIKLSLSINPIHCPQGMVRFQFNDMILVSILIYGFPTHKRTPYVPISIYTKFNLDCKDISGMCRR